MTTPSPKPPTSTATLVWRASLAAPFALALVVVLWVRLTASPHAPADPPPEPLRWTLVSEERYIETWTRVGSGIVGVGELGRILDAGEDASKWRERAIVVAGDIIPAYEDLPAIPAEPILETTPGIAVARDGGLLVVGGLEESADSTILRSTDGARTWVRATEIEAGLLTSVRFAGSMGLASGPAGAVVRTEDNGRTWARVRTPTDLNLFDVAVTESGHAWAVGEQGVALRSEDGGRTWTGAVFGRQPLYATALLDDRRGWAVGAAGTILATEDGGRTFVSQGIPAREGAARLPAFTAVAVLRDARTPLVVVAGQGGIVLVGRGDGAWTDARLPEGAGTVTTLLDMGSYVLAATDERRIYRAEVPGR